jgi:hypothetical protein
MGAIDGLTVCQEESEAEAEQQELFHFRKLGNRQGNKEYGAFAGFAFEPDTPVVGFDDLAADIKTEADLLAGLPRRARW